MAGPLQPAPRREEHAGRVLLGHGEPGLRHDRAAGEADHAAPVRRLHALSAVPPDAEGPGGGGPRCQCPRVRLPGHHLQSDAVPDHGDAAALHVRGRVLPLYGEPGGPEG
uniref:(northern house mosquito) hypothetical protein n=1 Tax=Culex pipiens TaxID=7175 RepID=A0A8D8DXZ9_CULPI